jgi:hypothetical protein
LFGKYVTSEHEKSDCFGPKTSALTIVIANIYRLKNILAEKKLFVHKDTGVNDWCTLICEYLRVFSKKFEMAGMVYSVAWGKLIHEKNQKSKIS